MIPCFDQPDIKAKISFSVINGNVNWVSAANATLKVSGVYDEVTYRNNAP